MKLVSLNVEGERHWGDVIPLLEREDPDIICLQEVFELSLENIHALGYSSIFSPTTVMERGGVFSEFGIAICTKNSIHDHKVFPYDSNTDRVTYYNDSQKSETVLSNILIISVKHGQEGYLIGTTHFTWAPDGAHPSPEQEQDMALFLKTVSKFPPHVMCGDFNIPRGVNPLYDKLMQVYTDEIPQHYTSSLDPDKHHLGNNPDLAVLFDEYMVDYILSQPPYRATNVRLEFGISDHAAVIGTIC